MAGYFGDYEDYLCVLGAVSVCYVAVTWGSHIARVLYRTLRRSFPLNPTHFGRWAVVTGCTDGIGKSYALQLAEKGMDMILISRDLQKLTSLAQHIEEQYKVSVKVVQANFKNTDIYDNIRDQLTGLDIGVLVNNVGTASPRSGCYFCEDDKQTIRDIINVNVLSCVMMSSIVLPKMVKKGRGLIINLSSFAGARPVPFLTLYSATKAFIRFFSEALSMEYSSQGVKIQVVTPSLVQSKLADPLVRSQGIDKGILYVTPDTYVRAALRTIGHEARTCAYWPHELHQYLLLKTSDASLTSRMHQCRDRMVQILKNQ